MKKSIEIKGIKSLGKSEMSEAKGAKCTYQDDFIYISCGDGITVNIEMAAWSLTVNM